MSPYGLVSHEVAVQTDKGLLLVTMSETIASSVKEQMEHLLSLLTEAQDQSEAVAKKDARNWRSDSLRCTRRRTKYLQTFEASQQRTLHAEVRLGRHHRPSTRVMSKDHQFPQETQTFHNSRN